MWCKCQVSFAHRSFFSWMWCEASFLLLERITMSNWYWIPLSFHFELFDVLRSEHSSELFTVKNILGESKWLCFISVFSKERGFCSSFCSGLCLYGVQSSWHLAHFNLYIFNDRMVVVFGLKGNIELLIEPIPCRKILLSIGLDAQWLMMLTKIERIICIESEWSIFSVLVFTLQICKAMFYTSWAH